MTNHYSFNSLTKYNPTTMRFGLAQISRVLAKLNNPHTKYKTILVGGTNGKGSVAAMISSVLSKAGLRTGLYTSPHLIDFRERIRINGAMITSNELNKIVKEIEKQKTNNLTYFELTTAIALLYFARSKVDIAVLEIGLGGRLDATNIVNPELSIITNISLEHQEYLGNTVDEIAREKAGIIKSGGIFVTGARQKKVIAVFRDICGQQNAVMYCLGRDFRIRKKKDGSFSYKGMGRKYKNITVPLLGIHQRKNAALALAAFDILAAKGFPITEEVVICGLKNVAWEGRLEVVAKKPSVVLDGAHNPAGITALCKALREDFLYNRLIVVFGVLSTKDYRKMISQLLSIADKVYFTRPSDKRGLSPKDLMAAVQDKWNVEVIENCIEAVSQAIEGASEKDLVCITGSLYLLGEIKEKYHF